jgi:hypothetical protein
MDTDHIIHDVTSLYLELSTVAHEANSAKAHPTETRLRVHYITIVREKHIC